MWTSQHTTQTDTLTRTGPGLYTYSNGLGWWTTNVPISGSSATIWICGNGGTYSQADQAACPVSAHGQWHEHWHFDTNVPPGHPYTATGDYIGVLGNGTVFRQGTFKAVGPTPASCSLKGVRLAGGVVSAGASPSCPRATAINVVCSYQGESFISFGRITKQSCFATVRDRGPQPFEYPEGSVLFKPFGLTDANPCVLSDSVSNGVTECEVSLSPPSGIGEGDTFTLRASFIPADSKFRRSKGSFAFRYTPMLDQSNKVTAARAEAHLILVGAIATAIGSYVPPLKGVAKGTVASAALLAAPLHYMQLPDEPPDPAYARVFEPRIVPVGAVRASSKALATALTALDKSDQVIEAWSGADWNALNRSVIAGKKNNRVAFVTQMSAASKDEAKLAALVSVLPAELQAVERSSPSAYRTFFVSVPAAQLSQVRRTAATLSAAEQQRIRSVGLTPSLVSSLLTAPAQHLTRSSVDGNAFAKLSAVVRAEASTAPFLRKVSAIHAAMASLYR